MKKIIDYKPYKDFEDLRNYKLSNTLFLKLWKIQDMLYHMSKRYKYYQMWHPSQLQQAKEISAMCLQLLDEKGQK